MTNFADALKAAIAAGSREAILGHTIRSAKPRQTPEINLGRAARVLPGARSVDEGISHGVRHSAEHRPFRRRPVIAVGSVAMASVRVAGSVKARVPLLVPIGAVVIGVLGLRSAIRSRCNLRQERRGSGRLPAVRGRRGDTQMRIGDTERDSITSALREHYAAGRLTRVEFDERLEIVWRAKTGADLFLVLQDLPELRDR